MDENNLKILHSQSSQHRAKLLASKECGCFYCGATFAPSAIVGWYDNEQTAACPRCSVDSVLPDSPTAETLELMRKHWFG